MAAKIMTVSLPETAWGPDDVDRLWFFPDGSEYLRYAPHFHLIHESGFRQNLPLNYMFVVVLEGKLSVKNFHGGTIRKIHVKDQVWYDRGQRPVPHLYRQIIHNIRAIPVGR